MRYGSVCSGIEAATVAWHPLGWRPSFFSEIEAFPRAVLDHHYPTVPLHGDFTTIQDGEYDPIDLLVGGTPCQDFSVAGLRAGMAGDRGNLTLQFLTLAQRLRPKWLVWENVPGVLSSNGGRDFGSFLGGLGELGYGWSYRTLDAQYFGVPQRRRRVFAVGHLGDWRRAAAVLFERHSLQGHSAPSREAGAGVTQALTCRLGSGGPDDNKAQGGFYLPVGVDGGVDVSHALTASQTATGRLDPSMQTFIAFGWQNSASQGDSVSEHVTPTLDKSKTPAIAFSAGDNGRDVSYEVCPTLRKCEGGGHGQAPSVKLSSGVRRLTPRECERLQGFPDDYTLVPYRGKPAADGPRYKALGNSMAVPVMAWIGGRIHQVESMICGGN